MMSPSELQIVVRLGQCAPPQHHPEVTAIYLGNRGKVGPVGYLETDGDVTGCSFKKTWPQNPKYIVKKVHKPLG